MSALDLIVSAAALAAQGGTDAAPPSATSQPYVSATSVPASDVPGRTADVISGGAFDLDINEKKSEMTLSYAWGAHIQWNDAQNRQAEAVQNAFTAELTLPLGGGDNLLTREAFNGLADGPSLSLSWTSFGMRAGDPMDAQRNPMIARYAREAAQVCEAGVQAGSVTDFTVEQCRLYATRPERVFLRRFSGRSIPELNRAMLSLVTGYGIEASVGTDRFNFRTPVTLAENSATRRQFSVKAYGILFPPDGVSMLTGSARYESSYEALDDQILCRAVVVNANDDCVSAPPGPPNHVEKLQLEVQYRRVFSEIPSLGRFAIAPRVAFDALNNDYELELPIYLIPSGTNRILPGFTISYDSRHDEVVLGLFLRRAFSFGS